MMLHRLKSQHLNGMCLMKMQQTTPPPYLLQNVAFVRVSAIIAACLLFSRLGSRSFSDAGYRAGKVVRKYSCISCQAWDTTTLRKRILLAQSLSDKPSRTWSRNSSNSRSLNISIASLSW